MEPGNGWEEAAGAGEAEGERYNQEEEAKNEEEEDEKLTRGGSREIPPVAAVALNQPIGGGRA